MPQKSGTNMGSSAPARKARKIVYRCLHCQSPLSVRPVAKTSRLNCPKCKKELFVSANGRMFKQRPSSTVVRKKNPEAPQGAGGGETAEEVSLKNSNPLSSVAIHSTTAFDAHRKKNDPNKTFFLTDEETLDLSEIELDADESAPVEHPSADQFLVDDEDFADEDRRPVRPAPRPPSRKPKALRKGGGPASRGGNKVQAVVGCLIAAMIVSLPFHVVAVFHGKSALAKESGDPAEVSSFVERFGQTVSRGVRKVLATDRPPRP